MRGLRKFLQVTILIIAIVMTITGAMNHEMKEVWSKAVMICMECIGIG